MQNIIDGFLRPPIPQHSSPPVINLEGTTVIRKDYYHNPITISVYSSKWEEPNGVILYCHSFGSTKHEAELLLPIAIKNGMRLASFTFMRVKNDGKIDKDQGVVTFGYREAEQVEIALRWIQEHDLGSTILWGRSMGAVAALRSQLQNPTVSGIILDSPY